MSFKSIVCLSTNQCNLSLCKFGSPLWKGEGRVEGKVIQIHVHLANLGISSLLHFTFLIKLLFLPVFLKAELHKIYHVLKN